MDESTVLREVAQLQIEMMRLGSRGADGKIQVTFGTIYDDDRCQQVFEALAGTLKAAKKRKVIDYNSPLLLKGAHDKVVITLLEEPSAEAATSAGAGSH